MGEVQIENIVLDCNRLAMDHLVNNNLKACLHLLRRAQDLLTTPEFPDSKTKLLAITFNNLGCYHKAANKNNLALQAFEKALELNAEKLLDKQKAAEIHVNICYIKDAFSQFENLLFHAKCALELLNGSNVFSKELVPLGYYFMGKGFQGLEKIPQALKSFKIGLEISYKELGHIHPTTCMLLKFYLNASSQASTKNTADKPKDLIISQKQPKKYVFEHSLCKTPEIMRNSSNFSNKKNSSAKTDKNYVIETLRTSKASLDEFINTQTHTNKLNSTTNRKSDVSARSTSSNSKRLIEKTLPKLRTVSISQMPDTNYEKYTEKTKRPESSYKIMEKTKKPEPDYNNYIEKPKRPESSYNSKDRLKRPDSRCNNTIEKTTVLNDSFLYEKVKNSDKSFQPMPPPSIPRKKPPASARTVHFRKPSTDSLHSTQSNSEDFAIPKIVKPIYPILTLNQVILIQKH